MKNKFFTPRMLVIRISSIFLPLILLSISVIITSCNDNKELDAIIAQTPSESHVELDRLAASLSDYVTEFEPMQTTRNGWRWVSAAFADYGGVKVGAEVGFHVGVAVGGFHGAAVGVIAGGVVVGAIASVATLLSDMTVPYDTTGKIMLNVHNKYDFVGLKHNAIVGRMLEKKDLILTNGKVDMRKLCTVAIEAAKEEGYDAENLTSSLVEQVVEETSSLSLDAECVNAYFKKEISLHPEDAAVLRIEEQQIFALMELNSERDLKRFTDGYESIIAASAIDEIDKQALLSSSSLIKNSMVAYEIKASEN